MNEKSFATRVGEVVGTGIVMIAASGLLIGFGIIVVAALRAMRGWLL